MSERRSTSEVIARHLIARGLQDIYCEGVSDARLIEISCQYRGWNSIDVFPIDAIDVPAELTSSSQLTGGNKARLLTLAKTLTDEGVRADQVAIIVDSDVDRYVSIPSQRKLDHGQLVYATEFNDAGLYWYDSAAIRKVMSLHSTMSHDEQTSYLQAAEDACRAHFAARVVSVNNELAFSRPQPMRAIKKVSGVQRFDEEAYFASWLGKQSAAIAEVCKNQVLNHLEATKGGDLRHCVDSHCLLTIISYMLSRRVKNAAFRDEQALRTVLSASLDISKVANSALFDAIGKKFFER